MGIEKILFRCVANSLEGESRASKGIGPAKINEIRMPVVRKIMNEGLKRYPINTNN